MRESRLSFRLSEAKKAELEAWAQEYGVTVSALLSFIVGEWLQRKARETRVQEAFVRQGAELLGQHLGELSQEEQRQVTEALERVVHELRGQR